MNKASFLKKACICLSVFLCFFAIFLKLGDEITVSNTVNGRELPIYCVETDEKKIALTFDAAWGNEDTAKILEILKKHNIHVTFFMTGGWVENYPDDVKAILADGHDLGNHSENHKNMSQLSDGECKEELQKVHDKVKSLTGYDMFLFRPPYGDYDNHVITNAKSLGYYTIQWDVDSLDWKEISAGEILKRVSGNVQPGSIVLFHNAAKHTPEALPQVIEYLLSEGYEIIPVSEILLQGEYEMDHTGRQCPKGSLS